MISLLRNDNGFALDADIEGPFILHCRFDRLDSAA